MGELTCADLEFFEFLLGSFDEDGEIGLGVGREGDLSTLASLSLIETTVDRRIVIHSVIEVAVSNTRYHA